MALWGVPAPSRNSNVNGGGQPLTCALKVKAPLTGTDWPMGCSVNSGEMSGYSQALVLSTVLTSSVITTL